MFLVVANTFTEKAGCYDVKSAVYKMANNKLFLYQELPTTRAGYVHAFTHKAQTRGVLQEL